MIRKIKKLFRRITKAICKKISSSVKPITFKNEKEKKLFDVWAFGEIQTQYNLESMKKWNLFHVDKFKLNEFDNLQISMDKMYKIYKEESQKCTKKSCSEQPVLLKKMPKNTKEKQLLPIQPKRKKTKE